MREGEVAFVALAWTDHPAPATYDEAHRRLVYTADYWHEWLSHGDFPDHPWRTHLQRSALTLKGLIYAPTGAMVAAPTTSLPETPGGSRNWDYRYAWVRDSTFLLSGLYTLGFDGRPTTSSTSSATSSAARRLQVMYGIGGERELPERTLDHLHGYAGRAARAGRQRRRTASASTTSGARCWSRSTCTRSRATGSPSPPGASSARRSRRRSRTGASPTAGSGRCAASRSTSPPRSSCAGSRATAARGSRACARTRSARSAGRRRRTRSTPTSARTGSTSAACSSSTTTRPRSTPRAC